MSENQLSGPAIYQTVVTLNLEDFLAGDLCLALGMLESDIVGKGKIVIRCRYDTDSHIVVLESLM